MRRTTCASALILALLASTLMGTLLVKPAAANPEGPFPNLSMPVEYVNYTVVSVDGALWTKIDGYYPIYVLKQQDCVFNGDLPMVYPMPPNTTNIHVTLGESELSWVNYTEAYPDALHHTAVGNWWMIYTELGNVSGFFVLKIHYEHPLQMVNGSYIFLYDLNISPYLTAESNNSTCFYTIRLETNTSGLAAYTTKNDSQWNPINYTTTKDGTTEVVSIQEHSEYGKPLLGDLVVEFSVAAQVPEFPVWTLPALAAAILLATLIYKKKATAMP